MGGNGDDIWIGPNTDVGTDYFFPDYNPVRICLYINYGGDNRVLVANTVFDAGTGTTTPAPTPVPPLSVSAAAATIPAVLRREYRSRFNRRTLRRSCKRLGTERVRCRVDWRQRGYRYAGTVTMWNDPDDPANRLLYRTSIRRKRI